jgi:hypothetical protein
MTLAMYGGAATSTGGQRARRGGGGDGGRRWRRPWARRGWDGADAAAAAAACVRVWASAPHRATSCSRMQRAAPAGRAARAARTCSGTFDMSCVLGANVSGIASGQSLAPRRSCLYSRARCGIGAEESEIYGSNGGRASCGGRIGGEGAGRRERGGSALAPPQAAQSMLARRCQVFVGDESFGSFSEHLITPHNTHRAFAAGTHRRS